MQFRVVRSCAIVCAFKVYRANGPPLCVCFVAIISSVCLWGKYGSHFLLGVGVCCLQENFRFPSFSVVPWSGCAGVCCVTCGMMGVSGGQVDFFFFCSMSPTIFLTSDCQLLCTLAYTVCTFMIYDMSCCVGDHSCTGAAVRLVVWNDTLIAAVPAASEERSLK